MKLIVRSIGLALGAAIGLLSGFFVAIAVVVAKAWSGSYLFAVGDFLKPGPETALLLAGIVLGGYHGWRSPQRGLRILLLAATAAAGAALVGALIVRSSDASPEAAWAVGICAAAVLFVFVVVVAPGLIKKHSFSRLDLGMMIVLGVFALLGYLRVERESSQRGALVKVGNQPVELPSPESVSEVVFIIGDAGATSAGSSPILTALSTDIVTWARALPKDSAVTVLYPGDLVYPVGVRDRDDPMYARDSSRLWNQIMLVGGDSAKAYGARGVFIAGNHDWGGLTGAAGVARLRNLETEVLRARALGIDVALLPEAGLAGPDYRDLGDHLRLVFFDTHWFLQETSRAARDRLVNEVGHVVADAGSRRVVIVAHHPFKSGGLHGAVVPDFSNYGIEYLLSRTGAIAQDLNAPIYAELVDGLKTEFRAISEQPLAFVAGHDHSLQVIAAEDAAGPKYALVSGAGSKLSALRSVPGMRFGASRPGYMMLVVGRDGAVDLFVVAGDPSAYRCDAIDPSCMTRGVEAFEIAYSERLADGLVPPHQGTVADSTAR